MDGDGTEESANADGLGLGLNICHNIVKKNGGYIEVHSNGENQGTTFMFGMKMQIPSMHELSAENFDNNVAAYEEVKM